MRRGGRRRASGPGPSPELADLRARLSEAEATLHAIQTGGVDALVVAGDRGPRVYTLEGAEHIYRVLIESMNEGAVTLTAGTVILYANQSFARMVKRPLEQLLGSPFLHLLPAADRTALRAFMRRAVRSGSRLQVSLDAGGGSQVPAQISIRPFPKQSSHPASIGMVVTDMTESRLNQETLRGLSHRLAQAQESERARLAAELTDSITQPLVVILFRLQALLGRDPAHELSARGEVESLRALLGQTAEEVERISRGLRPSVLSTLGLVAALQVGTAEFAKRTGLDVRLSCVRLNPLPPLDAKLALYRIFEAALSNVELHARARRVTVRLTQSGAFAQLAIKDDGIGFNPDRSPARLQADPGYGLARMRERAAFLGGVLTITSTRRAGTVVKVRIPLSPGGRKGS